jgi:hypothetical protein
MKRIFGMGVGVVWLVMAFIAFDFGRDGWAEGFSDLGFWWDVIAAILAIAGCAALIGTWIHTRPTDA